MKFAKLALAVVALGLLAWPSLADEAPKAPAKPVAAAPAAPAPAAAAQASPAKRPPAATASAAPAKGEPGASAAPATAAEQKGAAAAPAVAKEEPPAKEAAKAAQGKAPASKVAEHHHKHEIQLGPVGYDAKGRPGHIHVVQPGDTLWDISDAYLGTPWIWPSVWHDNANIENPNLIYPGERLWISPTDIRPVTKAEAEKLMKGKPAEMAVAPMPAEISAPDNIDSLAKPTVTYRYSPMDRVGFISDKQLAGTASIVSSPADQEMLDTSTPVVIGLGKGEVKVGDRFDIFRTTKRVVDPVTGRHCGYVTDELGWLEVTSVHDQTSLARVRRSFDPILRGDHIRPYHETKPDIAVGPRPNVEGHLVYTDAGRVELGQGDVVFLNRGSRDGLAVGSPLEVYRAGGHAVDHVRHKRVKVLDTVVAKLLVVRANPDDAVAVVTHSKTVVRAGDLFRGAKSISF